MLIKISEMTNEERNIKSNQMIEEFKESVAENEGVKFPNSNTQNFITLLIYFINKNIIINKVFFDEELSYIFGRIIDCQNARHLGRQQGFNILQGGCNFNNYKLKRGEYVFIGFEGIHKGWSKERRISSFAPDITWEEIKECYEYRCAHCGSLENEDNLRNPGIVTILEKAHMDYGKELNIENIIPLCSYCNKFYKDRAKFDKLGNIIDLRK